MGDPKLWWAIMVVVAGFIAKTAVDWWRTDNIDERVKELEKWRIKELENNHRNRRHQDDSE